MLYLWIFFSSLLILATIFATFAKKHWFFDLWTHFRPQYYLLSIVLIFLNPYVPDFNHKNLLLAFIIFTLIINGKEIFPYFKLLKPTLSQRGLGDFRILFQNIYKENIKTNKLINLINEQNPDIAAIVEYRSCHDMDLHAIKSKYENFWGICLDNGFGMALFSKYKFELIYKGGFEHMPFAIFKIFHPKKPFLFTIFHPSPPMSQTWAKAFQSQIKELESEIKKLNQDIIVVGDFNASPWGWHFKNFLKQTNLQDPRKIFGFNFSWMRSTPFFLPIDHILSSQSFKFQNFKICKSVGSDHRGLIAEIKI